MCLPEELTVYKNVLGVELHTTGKSTRRAQLSDERQTAPSTGGDSAR